MLMLVEFGAGHLLRERKECVEVQHQIFIDIDEERQLHILPSFLLFLIVILTCTHVLSVTLPSEREVVALHR